MSSFNSSFEARSRGKGAVRCHLKVQTGGAVPERLFDIMPGKTITIGRASSKEGKNAEAKSNNALFENPTISRYHAELSCDQEGKITIRDLGSTHGTAVNGIRLRHKEPFWLRQYDIIKLGNDVSRGSESYTGVSLFFTTVPTVESLDKNEKRTASTYAVPASDDDDYDDGDDGFDDGSSCPELFTSSISDPTSNKKQHSSAVTTPEPAEKLGSTARSPIVLDMPEPAPKAPIPAAADDVYDSFLGQLGFEVPTAQAPQAAMQLSLYPPYHSRTQFGPPNLLHPTLPAWQPPPTLPPITDHQKQVFDLNKELDELKMQRSCLENEIEEVKAERDDHAFELAMLKDSLDTNEIELKRLESNAEQDSEMISNLRIELALSESKAMNGLKRAHNQIEDAQSEVERLNKQAKIVQRPQKKLKTTKRSLIKEVGKYTLGTAIGATGTIALLAGPVGAALADWATKAAT